MSISKAYASIVMVRSKLDLGVPLSKKLEICASFIAAQAQADKENKLGPQVIALAAFSESIPFKLGQKVDLQAEMDSLDGEIAREIRQLEGALEDYSTRAARLAGTDAVLLDALGVKSAKKREPNGAHPVPDAPTGLVIRPGTRPGEAIIKCGKVPYAGAYMFEYKLEPSLPSDPWLPNGGGIVTKRVSATLSDLAPSQLLRARVRAIGDQRGPWSEEVLGRTK